MSKTKTNAATVAAPAPNENPATAPAEEAHPATAGEEGTKVFLTLSEENAGNLFARLTEYAQLCLTGGRIEEADFEAVAEIAGILAEVKNWDEVPPAAAPAPAPTWGPDAVETISNLTIVCERYDNERKRLAAECERLTSEVEVLTRKLERNSIRLAEEIGPKCAACEAECGSCPPECEERCPLPPVRRKQLSKK